MQVSAGDMPSATTQVQQRQHLRRALRRWARLHSQELQGASAESRGVTSAELLASARGADRRALDATLRTYATELGLQAPPAAEADADTPPAAASVPPDSGGTATGAVVATGAACAASADRGAQGDSESDVEMDKHGSESGDDQQPVAERILIPLGEIPLQKEQDLTVQQLLEQLPEADAWRVAELLRALPAAGGALQAFIMPVRSAAEFHSADVWLSSELLLAAAGALQAFIMPVRSAADI